MDQQVNTLQLRLAPLVANEVVGKSGFTETLNTCFEFVRLGKKRLRKIVLNFERARLLGKIGQFDFDFMFFALGRDAKQFSSASEIVGFDYQKCIQHRGGYNQSVD